MEQLSLLRPESLLVDWSSVEWSQFTQISDFQWTLGRTPFSHFQVPLMASIFYLTSLVGLRAFMKDRKAFVLKNVTFVHNVILTCLSTVMFLGSAYGAYLKYQSQGFFAGLVCEQDPNPIRGPLFYWSFIFYLSKYYEFIDSYLLVLKKKPLIFLHVFHHFVMPYVCWAGLEGKWCMALWTSSFWNSFVHIWMYYYYSVSTLGYSPWWRQYLTGLQIYQFVSGVFYTGIYFYYYFTDLEISFSENFMPSITYKQGCTGDLWALIGMFSVNCSFLYLFSKFFKEQYLEKRRTKQKKIE